MTTQHTQQPVVLERTGPRPLRLGTHVVSLPHAYDGQVGEIIAVEPRRTPPLVPLVFRYLVQWPSGPCIWMWREEIRRVLHRDRKPLVRRDVVSGLRAIKRRVQTLRAAGIGVYVRTGSARRHDLQALGADTVLMDAASAHARGTS